MKSSLLELSEILGAILWGFGNHAILYFGDFVGISEEGEEGLGLLLISENREGGTGKEGGSLEKRKRRLKWD